MSNTSDGNSTELDPSILAGEDVSPNGVDGEVLTSDFIAEEVQPLPMVSLDNPVAPAPAPAPSQHSRISMEEMHDVPVTLVFEVGRTNITIKELMELREGSFVELRHVSVDAIDVWINDKIIAEGEAIALQQRYGIRFGEVKLISIAENTNAKER